MPSMTEFEIKQLDLLGQINDKLGKVLLPGHIAKLAELTGFTSDPEIPKGIETPSIIEIDGMQTPWVLGGLPWDGKSEIYDEDELKDFLGFNPNGNDPDGKSWCAGFWLKILEKLGIDTTGLDLSAMSFANYGIEIKYTNTSDIPNGAFLVFQPKAGSKHRISHVGVKVDDDQLFGGNQGDSAKKSNLAWYLQNADLVGCRCPKGYKLV